MKLGAFRAGSGLTQLLRALLLAVIVVPVLLFGIAAWLNYNAIDEQAWEELIHATDAIEQHAQKVLQTTELILDQIQDRTTPLNWERIAQSADLHRMLQHLANILGQNSITGVIGPDRTIVATNRSFPMPAVQAPERSYIEIPRANGDPLYISEVNRGNYSGSPQFLIAEHKRNPDGSDSGGIVAVSLQLSNFADYYRSVVEPEDYVVTMTRSDGAILIRYPSDDSSPTMFPSGSKFLEQITQGAARGRFQEVAAPDSEVRLFAFRKVAEYPVYVTVGLARHAVVLRWAQFMASHLLFGLPAMLMLIVLALVGLRRSLAADRATAAAGEEAARRLAAEEALRQAQKMEAIGQLTGGVAHDFNNILQIILGNLSIVEFRLQERRLEPALRRAIEAATRAAGRAAVLTGQLLAFSRQQALEPRPVDPNQLIGKVSDLFHRTLGESIEIETLLGARIWKILVDPNQLENAIVNLAVNARDAMPAGGKLILETANVYLDETYTAGEQEVQAGQYVMIAVTDTGTGMSPEVMSKAFDPFFTTKEIGRGTGLGLSQVYGFIKQSGGHAKIYSKPGEGTTIRLYLPRLMSQAAALEDTNVNEPRLPHGKRESVLVVEDEADVRDYVAHVLRELNYDALEAVDGQAALEILESPRDIALLFTDIGLPGGLNGRQLADAARRLRPGIKVLFATGYGRDAIIHQGRLDPDVELISKPFTYGALATRVRDVLNAQESQIL